MLLTADGRLRISPPWQSKTNLRGLSPALIDLICALPSRGTRTSTQVPSPGADWTRSRARQQLYPPVYWRVPNTFRLWQFSHRVFDA